MRRGCEQRGHAAEAVAHFVNRLVFCLFADDVALLPAGLFARMLAAARRNPARFTDLPAGCSGRWPSGAAKWTSPRCSGSTAACSKTTRRCRWRVTTSPCCSGRRNWIGRISTPRSSARCSSAGLTRTSASQLGAHYTDREKIEKLVDPVIRRPLLAEWAAAKERIAGELAKVAGRAPAARRRAAPRTAAEAELRGFLDRLRAYRVLDPACGSGNFLYLSLLALKDLEHQAIVEAEALGLQQEFRQVGPEAVLGIEINPFAAELARVSVWIGHIQWARRHGLPAPADPVLRPLHTIECRDAVLAPDGAPAAWPKADAIVGNPPFLGDKGMIGALGEGDTTRLRAAYAGRVPGGADLVCYWFEKAREALQNGDTDRVGLVATNSIRGGANRAVLDNISAKASSTRLGLTNPGFPWRRSTCLARLLRPHRPRIKAIEWRRSNCHPPGSDGRAYKPYDRQGSRGKSIGLLYRRAENRKV